MLRRLYIWLLWRHPQNFRQRFGDEMLADFDQAGAPDARRLLADAVASLFRQWLLRPEFRGAEPAVPPGSPDVPVFHTFDGYKPHRGALLWGAMLSTGVLIALLFSIEEGWIGTTFAIGIHRPGSGLIPVDRSAFQEGANGVEVRMGSEPEDPLRGLASFYFKSNPVARALDADRDLVISPWEILTAPAALRRLDLDGDGSLSPEECGFHAGERQAGAEFLSRARAAFMRTHPLLAALDADRDGRISDTEIRNSSAALRTMDSNGDGMLTPIEVLPDPAAGHASLIMVRLDTNGDGSISRSERSAAEAEPLRELLDHADRNRDGAVTELELTNELRRRVEMQRQIDAARRAAGLDAHPGKKP